MLYIEYFIMILCMYYKVFALFKDKIGTVHRHIDSRLEERHRLASAAIKWTQQKEMPTGHPLLHQLFAVTYWKGL